MSQTTARTSAIPPPTRFTVELCKFIEDYCKAHADTSVVTVLGGLETIRYVITETYLDATLGKRK